MCINYGKLFLPRLIFLFFVPVSLKCWKRLLIIRLVEKNKHQQQQNTFNSASTTNQTNI